MNSYGPNAWYMLLGLLETANIIHLKNINNNDEEYTQEDLNILQTFRYHNFDMIKLHRVIKAQRQT